MSHWQDDIRWRALSTAARLQVVAVAQGAECTADPPPGYLLPVSLANPNVSQHGVRQHVVAGHPQQVAVLTLHQVIVGARPRMTKVSVLFLPGQMIH